MGRRSESHLLSLRLYAIRAEDHHKDRAQRVRPFRRKMPENFAVTQSERINRSATAPLRVYEFRIQGAVLLSTDSGRPRHQQQSRPWQLSGLPVSRSQLSFAARIFRALPLGALWPEVHG